MPLCKRCGNQLAPGAKYCSRCGIHLVPESEVPEHDRNEEIGYPASADQNPIGIGGWLLLFCVGLTIIGPLYSCCWINANWQITQIKFDHMPNLKLAAVWENAGMLALVVYGFVVGLMIWRGNANGREIAKKYLIIRLLSFILIEIVTIMLLGSKPHHSFTVVNYGVACPAIGEIFYFLIWWLYFKKSIRVRNTYGAAISR